MQVQGPENLNFFSADTVEGPENLKKCSVDTFEGPENEKSVFLSHDLMA